MGAGGERFPSPARNADTRRRDRALRHARSGRHPRHRQPPRPAVPRKQAPGAGRPGTGKAASTQNTSCRRTCGTRSSLPSASIARCTTPGVDAVLLHTDPSLVRDSSYLQEIVERFPGRMYAMAPVEEWRIIPETDAVIAETVRAIEEHGLHAVKVHPSAVLQDERRGVGRRAVPSVLGGGDRAQRANLLHPRRGSRRPSRASRARSPRSSAATSTSTGRSCAGWSAIPTPCAA